MLLTVALVGCGADTVDVRHEAEVMAETCASLQRRSTGRTGPVPIEEFERILRTAPGGPGDQTVVRALKRTCEESTPRGGPQRVPGFPSDDGS